MGNTFFHAVSLDFLCANNGAVMWRCLAGGKFLRTCPDAAVALIRRISQATRGDRATLTLRSRWIIVTVENKSAKQYCAAAAMTFVLQIVNWEVDK
jgi:hypothetical protein